MPHALRLLGALAVLAALSPLAAAQPIDCDDVPLSTGAVDPTYAACAEDARPVETGGGLTDHFGINNSMGGFVRFETCSALVPCTTFSPPGGGFLNAGDFDGNDFSAWYGIDDQGQAIAVDSGGACAVTQLGTIGSGWTGITYDYRDDTFYGLATTSCGGGTRLYEIDFQALTATPVGPVDTALGCGIALAAHPATGVLYSHDLITDQLFSIDKTTGQSTAIGPLGFDANFGQGMDFNNGDETLYLYAFNNATFVAELRTANINTGNTTLLCTLGVGLQQFGTASTETDFFSECNGLKLLTADLSYNAGTRRLSVDVTVRNNDPSPSTGQLQLDYNRMGGNPQGTRTLGMGTLPAGATVTRTINIRVPDAAPAGDYNFTLRLVDAVTGADCSLYAETIAISAPRIGGGSYTGELFAVEETVDLTPEASAVVEGEGVAARPNPFARRTTLSYAVEAAADVRLSVYDVLGREVAVLVDARMEAGTHSAIFDGSDLAAGTYVYRLVVGSDVRTGQLTLTR